MATKPFFRLTDYQGTQNLLKSLVTEAIQQFGQDMYYIPRRLNNFDHILGADDMSTFDTAYVIEMYVDSVTGFSGDQSFMSKFGVTIADQVFFSMSETRWEDQIKLIEGWDRPREGDLIFFPLNSRLFEIKYVDNKPDFYPTGTLPLFKMTCELFEASSEVFSTGITEIDGVYNKVSLDIIQWAYTDQNGVVLTDEDGNVLVADSYNIETVDPQADNDQLTKADQGLVDWSTTDPFGDIPNKPLANSSANSSWIESLTNPNFSELGPSQAIDPLNFPTTNNRPKGSIT